MEEQVARKVFAQWKPALTALGWNCVIPIAAGVSDQTVRTVELTLGDAKKRLPKVDENRVYLVGQGNSTADVFYTLSRAPDLWAADLVHGISAPAPRAAIPVSRSRLDG